MPPQQKESKKITIVKVPLADKNNRPVHPQKFPRMPRMYLELLENKAKIKQDLINKEYIPKEASKGTHVTDREVKENREIRENRDTVIKKKNEESISVSISSDSSVEEKKEDSDDEKDKSSSESSTSDEDSDGDSDEESDEVEKVHKKKRKNISSSSEDLSDRLKELLSDGVSKGKSEKVEKYTDKYSVQNKYDKTSKDTTSNFTPYDKYAKPNTTVNPAPTLAELEAKGQYQHKNEIRDATHIPMSEYEEEDKKRELIFKFKTLKKAYPESVSDIPEYTIHTDYKTMKSSYDECVRNLSLDSSVKGYKMYMVFGFMGIEYVFGSMLGFDMQGFCQHQVMNMHSYERLLIELGEKSYVPTGSSWPVELRLLGLILMNACIFILGRMMLKKTGVALTDMFTNISAPKPSQNVPQKPKRKMKGPDINIDDIPDAE